MIKNSGFIKFLAYLLCITIFIACKKEEVYLTGNIIGSAYGGSTTGNYQYEGVVVTIKGYDIEEIAYTDSTRRYFFNDVRAGTYDLYFEKSGYSSEEMLGVKHLGGESTIIEPVVLIPISENQ